MDALPKLIFNELEGQEQESRRFLKSLEERLPGWHIKLLRKNGKILFSGKEPSRICDALPSDTGQNDTSTFFELQDDGLVYSFPIEALNAEMFF